MMIEIPKELENTIKNLPELLNTLFEFDESFRLVFHEDWEFTKGVLTGESLAWYISEDGSFLHPGVQDEGNNWGNRGTLLNRYRRLQSALLTLKVCDHAQG